MFIWVMKKDGFGKHLQTDALFDRNSRQNLKGMLLPKHRMIAEIIMNKYVDQASKLSDGNTIHKMDHVIRNIVKESQKVISNSSRGLSQENHPSISPIPRESNETDDVLGNKMFLLKTLSQNSDRSDNSWQPEIARTGMDNMTGVPMETQNIPSGDWNNEEDHEFSFEEVPESTFKPRQQ